MSHCCDPLPIRSGGATRLYEDVGDAHAGVEGAVSLRPALALAALLLEHADLRPARLAFDDAHDAGVRDVRRSGQHFAAVLFDEEYLLECDARALLGHAAVHGHETA